MSTATLPKLLQPALKALEKDLLAALRPSASRPGCARPGPTSRRPGRRAWGFEPWRRERVTQLAVAWILSVVFVRTLEDRGYIDRVSPARPRKRCAPPKTARRCSYRSRRFGSA